MQAGTGGFSSTVNVVYDILGNITSKSDVGAYTYGGGACGGGTHAVTSVSGTKTASYCYDANGNMVSGDNRTIAYSAYDLPTEITKGNITTSFFYGPERQRYKRTDLMPEGLTTTIYAGGGAFEQIARADGALEKKSYIGGFAIVTERTSMGSTTTSTAYVLADHLGSIDTLTNEAGALLQKMSFDAWGKRRQQSWATLASPLYFDTSITTRGFTGHEEIDTVGLVHMNGRVYDPELGRFIQADPFVQDGSNAQSWNRYSYVLNNPLSMTDPTGYFFGSIFKAIGNFFSGIFKAVVSLIKAALKIPLLRAIIQIAACAGPQITFTCIAVTGALAVLAGGGIEGAIKAIAFTVASYGVWSAVGSSITGPLAESMGIVQDLANGVLNGATAAYAIAKGAIHGIVGGAMSLAQGGSFINGFVSNAVGAAAGVFSNAVSQGNVFADSVLVGAAGGAAAVLTGGKFVNGFVTAAFANMWNKTRVASAQLAAKARAEAERLLQQYLEQAPPGFDLAQTVARAESFRRLPFYSRWWAGDVGDAFGAMFPTTKQFQGDREGFYGFNYKLLGSKYENFGNFMYGYLGVKAGFFKPTLWLGAGAAQGNKWGVIKDNPAMYVWNWGDDAPDVPHVQRGIFVANSGL